jgi:hypothetical protein
MEEGAESLNLARARRRLAVPELVEGRDGRVIQPPMGGTSGGTATTW